MDATRMAKERHQKFRNRLGEMIRCLAFEKTITAQDANDLHHSVLREHLSFWTRSSVNFSRDIEEEMSRRSIPHRFEISQLLERVDLDIERLSHKAEEADLKDLVSLIGVAKEIWNGLRGVYRKFLEEVEETRRKLLRNTLLWGIPIIAGLLASGRIPLPWVGVSAIVLGTVAGIAYLIYGSEEAMDFIHRFRKPLIGTGILFLFAGSVSYLAAVSSEARVFIFEVIAPAVVTIAFLILPPLVIFVVLSFPEWWNKRKLVVRFEEVKPTIASQDSELQIPLSLKNASSDVLKDVVVQIEAPGLNPRFLGLPDLYDGSKENSMTVSEHSSYSVRSLQSYRKIRIAGVIHIPDDTAAGMYSIEVEMRFKVGLKMYWKSIRTELLVLSKLEIL